MAKKTEYLSLTMDGPDGRLVKRFASLLGTCKATAVKMHLRETLPGRIAQIEATRQDNSQAKSEGAGA